MIRNVHERVPNVPPVAVGALIDGLTSEGDRLWPSDRRPAMRLGRPLGVGASGGHGPNRYAVEVRVLRAGVRGKRVPAGRLP